MSYFVMLKNRAQRARGFGGLAPMKEEEKNGRR